MIGQLNKVFALAYQVAEQSPDLETKVGAILLDRLFTPLGHSCNGFIDGHSGNLPATRPAKYQYILHAERRLLFDCARQGIATEGAILVSTLSPCPECSRALWHSGIRSIFFRERYRNIAESYNMADLQVEENILADGTFQWDLSLRAASLIPGSAEF